VAKPTSYLIPNLIQGISQQADAQRDPSQGEAQINAVSSLGEGLRKRDCTVALAEVESSAVFVHPIQRDAAERYLAMISPSGVQVFDLAGDEKVVNAPGGWGYLAGITNPNAQLRAATIADTTFISNTLVTAAMLPALAPATPRPATHEALVWVKAANYGQTYSVNLNATQVSVTTQVAPVITSGGVPTTYPISTADIAEQIRVGLAGVSGVTITRTGSVLHFTSASTITIKATDARANADITAITNSVQAFTELPTIAPEGYQVEIVGDPGNRYDGYYVAFKVRDGAGTFGEGSWQETVAPGVEYRISPATMPHILVRLSSGEFYFGPANGATEATTGYQLPAWGDRTAGDYETAPDPSFIGHSIADVFVHKNRLGLLADESVILSRAQDFFEFFPETTVAVLDSDPIDVTASNNQVSVLRYAVSYQDELILFSDQLQFRFGSTDAVLTPATAQTTILTQFEIDPNVRPIQVAGAIVFCQKNGQWAQFREFSIRGAGNTLIADAESLSERTGSYVPSEVFRLAVNATGNAWYAVSEKAGYRNRIYTHKYFFRNTGGGGERVQASWSHWEFPGATRILQIVVIEEVLYLVVQYPGGAVWLEKMRVADRLIDDDSPEHPLLLDRRVSTTTATPAALRVAPGVYSVTTRRTTWTLPYAAASEVQAWSGYGSGGDWEEGVRLGTAEPGATTISAFGDWRDADVFFGETYEFFYEFTRFKAMKEIGGGKVALNEMRTQIRNAKLRFHETGFFEVVVTPEGRADSVHCFTAPGPEGEGIFTIPIMSEGRRARVRLRNDTARPCKFSTLEWVGLIAGRARGMQ
jgi:hypothetical protein